MAGSGAQSNGASDGAFTRGIGMAGGGGDFGLPEAGGGGKLVNSTHLTHGPRDHLSGVHRSPQGRQAALALFCHAQQEAADGEGGAEEVQQVPAAAHAAQGSEVLGRGAGGRDGGGRVKLSAGGGLKPVNINAWPPRAQLAKPAGAFRRTRVILLKVARRQASVAAGKRAVTQSGREERTPRRGVPA